MSEARKSFVQLIIEMRKAQKDAASYRSEAYRRKAAQLEKQVDEALARHMGAPKQPGLF